LNMSCRYGGWLAGLMVLLATSGCHIILGSEDFVDADGGAPANGGNGAGISEGGNGATGGGGGEPIVCDDGCSREGECHEGLSDPEFCGAPGTACVNCFDEVPECAQASACEDGHCVVTAVEDGTPCEAGVCRSGECNPCVGLECQIEACNDQPTTIRGRVFHPGGTIPLPNVRVYIPNGDLDDLTPGAQCLTCDTPPSGSPIAYTLTDATGSFELQNVPSGSVPIVVELGKWRRVVEHDIFGCEENELSDSTLRLPRNQREGNMPRIAMKTGQADTLECMLMELGVDNSEFTSPGEGGAITLYSGRVNGGVSQSTFTGALPPASELFTLGALLEYDVVLLGCEAQVQGGLPAGHAAALKEYTDEGGKVFISHFEYAFLQQGPSPWPSVATFGTLINNMPNGAPVQIVTSHAEGALFANWLGALVGAESQFPVYDGRASVQSLSSLGTPFLTSPQTGNSVTQFAFDTPIEDGNQQCGRVVFTDFHTTQGNDVGGTTFPANCSVGGALTPQELDVFYMLFDLTGCVDPD
jgi:hypothetical protein